MIKAAVSRRERRENLIVMLPFMLTLQFNRVSTHRSQPDAQHETHDCEDGENANQFKKQGDKYKRSLL